MRCPTAASLPHSRGQERGSCLPQVGPGQVMAPWWEPPPKQQGLDQILCTLSQLARPPGELILYGNLLPQTQAQKSHWPAEMEPGRAGWPKA